MGSKGSNREPLDYIILVNFAFFCQVTQLKEDLSYQFRVSAVNKAGMGPWSTESEPECAEDPIFPPSQPGTPDIVDVTAHTVSLSWTPPKTDGGAPVLGYKVEALDEVRIFQLMLHYTK